MQLKLKKGKKRPGKENKQKGKKMLGYKSAKIAEAMARRKNEVGLEGPGQICGPVELPDGSWGYWTAHNAWGNEPRGKVLLPKGRYIEGQVWRAYTDGFSTNLKIER